jgi:HD superfamily phosphohydrolase
MEYLNTVFNGELDIAISIFKNTYPKKFLHQLVSGQLDTDRLDYLKRDSFFTGVTEGGIGTERILKMLNVVDDELVVEEKGIYTVEQFIVARRIMYWQVYLHKTVITGEAMLLKAMQRAKELFETKDLFTTPPMACFFKDKMTIIGPSGDLNVNALTRFADIDDNDIFVSLKEWSKYPDTVISILADGIVNRNLFKVEISNEKYTDNAIRKIKNKIIKKYGLDEHHAEYLVFTDNIINKAYSITNDSSIRIVSKKGKVSEISEVSDVENIAALSKPVEKYFVCYPKNL